MKDAVVPDHVMQLGMGFWASKTVLSAVELGLFTELARGPLPAAAIRGCLNLHPRGLRDFLDTLVALHLLDRDAQGRYSNTDETDAFLDRAKPSYVGGILEMANARLYPFWGSLTEALRTGRPQNEAKSGGDPFETLYADAGQLERFLGAMTAVSRGSARAIAQQFPWRDYQDFVDVGGAQGGVAVELALAHSHLKGGNFDLPPVGPVFEAYVRGHELSDRLRFFAGDFFRDPLPSADVLIMGHILHDWTMEQKQLLLKKAFEALPSGGALIVFEALIDDERRDNAFSLLMSLNMLIETPGGFDFTGADCTGWMRDAGFRLMRVEHLAGPDSMVIGFK